jgi:hypothetical protein
MANDAVFPGYFEFRDVDQRIVGRISWDTKAGFKFEGATDESAKIFFSFLKQLIDAYIANQN